MRKISATNSQIKSRAGELARRLYSQTSMEAIGSELIRQMGALIGHESLVLCGGDVRTQESVYHAHDMGSRFMDFAPVIHHYRHQIPYVPYYLKHPGTKPVRTEDVVHKTEWRKSGLLNEGFMPLGFTEQLAVHVPTRRGMIRGLMLNRWKAGFCDRDVQVLDLMRGHIAAAAAIADQWSEHDEGGSTLLRRGSIVVDGRGCPMIWSGLAQRLLADYVEMKCTPRCDLPEAVSAWLSREITLHGSGELWRSPRKCLRFTKDHEQQQLVLQLSSSDDGRSHVVVMVESFLSGAGRRAIQRLSSREREVLEWVARGKTNEEIAQVLSMSVFTVKNHMKRILSVLGVENRTAAAAMYWA